MSILTRNSFTFTLSNDLQCCDAKGNPITTRTLYLYEPQCSSYEYFLKLRSLISRSFMTDVVSLTNSIMSKESEISQNVSKQAAASEEDIAENLTGVAIDLLGDNYAVFVKNFQDMICNTDVCAVEETGKVPMKAGWLSKFVSFSDLESLMVKYTARFITPKKFTGA